MKQTKTLLRVVPLLLLLALLLSACGKNDPWAEATYLEDTTLGEGIFTVTIKVTADDKTVTSTTLSRISPVSRMDTPYFT